MASCKPGSRLSVVMGSSVRRLERTRHRIFKDLSALNASVGLYNSKLSSASARISNLLVDLQRITDDIARRNSIVGNTESVQADLEFEEAVTTLPEISTLPLPLDQADSTSSRTRTPERTPSPDIRCFETFLDTQDPWDDLEFMQNGSGVPPVLESQDWPTNDFPMHSLRNHVPNGGLDIC
jgi:hypothetical protein